MTKALVLSGGGSVGIAWQTGLAAGLARAGADLRDADFFVGTSAGSAVGAQLALRRDFDEQVARYRQAGPARASAASGAGAAAGGATAERMAKLMQMMAEAMTDEGPPEKGRAAIGRFALDAATAPEEQFVDAFPPFQGAP